MENEILKGILSRRSIRKYTKENIPEEDIDTLLEAGRWAPSGLNNQPWGFCIIRNSDIKDTLSGLTSYSRIVKESNGMVCISEQIDHVCGTGTTADV